jgi:transcriptional regulator with XRE-family HTH domain
VLRLQMERLRRGWTQVDLAYRAKVTPSEISRIERGQGTPYANQGKRLAKALRLRPNQLLETVDDERARVAKDKKLASAQG